MRPDLKRCPFPQILGITSYSHWPEAVALRECARNSSAVQRRLLQMAEGRLRRMLHVGLMEELDLSIASLAVSCAAGRLAERLLCHNCRCAIIYNIVCASFDRRLRPAGNTGDEAWREDLESCHPQRLLL